jgi:hypothetical protein
MTYIMLDGWTSIAAEVLRLFPLICYHITSAFLVKTDKERMKKIPATPAAYYIILPRLSLYFLLGLVYSVISPLILPFVCVYFAFGFLIYRNQVCTTHPMHSVNHFTCHLKHANPMSILWHVIQMTSNDIRMTSEWHQMTSNDTC